MKRLFILSVAVLVVLVAAADGHPFRPVCQPNSVFSVGCNICWCNAEGTDMSCTRKECPRYYEGSSEPMRKNRRKMKKMCEPGSFFKMDCNDCKCNDDGITAACTLKACPHF